MFESAQRLFAELLASGETDATAIRARASDTTAVPPSDRLSARQLIDRIAAAERLVHALQAAQRQDIAAFARARLAADDDLSLVGSRLRGRTIGTELALALHTSPTAGASRATLAATATEDHPALSALAEKGEVSEYALRLVARETEVLPPEQRRLVDAQLAYDVTNAGGLTPGRLRQAASRRTIAIDPYAATRRCERARNDRAFGVMDPCDGTATLWARLRAEEALAVHQSIDTTARRLRAEGDERSLANLRCDLLVQAATGSGPSMVISGSVDSARAASAVPPHMSTHTQPTEFPPNGEDPHPADNGENPHLADEGDDPHPADDAWDSYPLTEPPREAATPTAEHPVDRSSTQRYPMPMPVRAKVELQIVMAASTLLGLDQKPATLRGYGAIPTAIAAQILDAANGAEPAASDAARPDTHPGTRTDIGTWCGGRSGRAGTGVLVRRLLCDPVDGRLIGMDTKTRGYTGPLRQFAAWRDQACRLSDAPIVDIDHITRYADAGPTTAANGQGLSKNTHVLRDHPQVSVRTLPPQHEAPAQRSADSSCDSGCDSGEDRSIEFEHARRSHRLSWLRQSAPDLEWTMPTGHTYRRRPPPALGWGSGATPGDPPPPPDAKTAARLAAKRARALRRELASQRRRLADGSASIGSRQDERLRGHPC